MAQDENKRPKDCVTPNSIPPEELSRYRARADPDSEADIANYVQSQAEGEEVLHVEKIKNEIISSRKYEVWEAITDQNRWWVITNLTNLYSQEHFPSLDYTLTFHVGLMLRMQDHSERVDQGEPHPLFEVFRRHEQANDRIYDAIEVADFQNIGMSLRECLLSLADALRRHFAIASADPPKASDFVAWMDLILDELCSGSTLKPLRKHLRSACKECWQLANWLTHHRKANRTATMIVAQSCDTLTGHLAFLTAQNRIDEQGECPQCKSRHIRSHYDINLGEDGDYYITCGECGWSSRTDEVLPAV